MMKASDFSAKLPSEKEPPADGVHGMVPREQMPPEVRRLRDTYAIAPGAPFYQKEFGFFALETWKGQGLVPENLNLIEFFDLDPIAEHLFWWEAGWIEPPYIPWFEPKVLEERGEYELVQDTAGRGVLYFKSSHQGYMPIYESAPVVDWKSWEEKCKWRLDPDDERRYRNLDERMAPAIADARKGFMIKQLVVGGYMYLRALMGPEGLMYMMLEQPDLVHECMKTWLRVSDGILMRHQQYVSFDILSLGEDSCYNHGPLISPNLMREFLLPYYQQLIENVKARQVDKKRRLHIEIDSDGNVDIAIPLYQEIGMNSMVPFEVAAGCDVVKIGRQYPDLVIAGGIDKRVMAAGPDEIDRHLAAILPVMRERGGYIPTCDHCVPVDVPLDNYLHYRKRCREYGD
jgi:uroporphyrinogen decarboxylase